VPSDPPPASHYFDAAPTTPSEPKWVELALPDLSITLASDRAVFSGDRVDPGSKFLLLEAPAPPASAAEALDLGCGYGPIALTLAHRSPATRVWAVDVNARAVELCRDNAAALGLANVEAVQVSPSDPTGTVPDDIRFDLIWSNPPIRIGKDALHELLLAWLARLVPDGTALLVVQKHLGADSLQRWLIDQGHPADRLATRAGYRLLGVGPAPVDRASGPAVDDRPTTPSSQDEP
jgi:16S rRNA (guanine1207-N2)-methyltransferase